MSNFNPMICRKGIDFARGFAFMLETRREADPGPTQNMYRIMLRSATYGGMFLYEDGQGNIAALACYSIGTDQGDFKDVHVVHVDYILMKPKLQRSLYYLKCMNFFADTIPALHPEVTIMTMEAEASVKQNNRLYSKFARLTGTIQGDLDLLNVYETTMEEFSAFCKKMMKRFKEGSVG